jgi:hypothetical protein
VSGEARELRYIIAEARADCRQNAVGPIARPLIHRLCDAAERALSRLSPGNGYAEGLEAAAKVADQLEADWNLHAHEKRQFGKDDSFMAASASAASKIAKAIRTLSPTQQPAGAGAFQARVQPWMLACFGAEIAADRLERSDRFIEEALELVQACGYSADRAHALVDYTFGRPIGEPTQEVGGVMVTLAALCLAAGLDMHDAGEAELARINVPETIAKIRAKQAAKPTGSALPIAPPTPDQGA